MRTVLIAAAAAVMLVSQVSGQSPTAAKVELTFAPGGIVTLITHDASLREILAEWTRKSGTPFVGAERLTGSALTLEFKDRPETEVLASLLRGASGYVLGPRPSGDTNPSQIQVVYVVATSTATSGGYSAPQQMSAPPPQVSTVGSPENEIPPIGPGRSGQGPENFPQNGSAVPQGSPMPAPTPRPFGTSPVAVPIVTVPVTTSTPTPTPTGTGRLGGAGGSR